jgi:hypothetical protein
MIRAVLSVLTGTTAAVLFSAAGSADTGQWKFNVVNKSNLPIVEFRTKEDGDWSENWISDRIEPGDDVVLDFETSEGDCIVRTQVRYTDGGFFDADVDYCKARIIEVLGETMVWK